MKYHQVKTKIDNVFKSCDRRDQLHVAIEYCFRLAVKSFAGMSESLKMIDYIRVSIKNNFMVKENKWYESPGEINSFEHNGRQIKFIVYDDLTGTEVGTIR